MPHLNHTLINPNQLRDYGVEVQDNPYASEPMKIKSKNEEFTACLKSKGATIYFDSWLPSNNDLASFPHIILSSHQEWDQSNIAFPNATDSGIYDIESRNVSEIRNDEKLQSSNEYREEIGST